MNKFLTKLRNLEGTVNADSKTEYLQSTSPSVNWTFGNSGHGIPFGLHTIFWGPPKSGKSLVAKMFAAKLHATDPEAIVIEFNTELRGRLQSDATSLKKFGVDPDRYISYDVNQPELIFDRIEQEIASLCQEGAKIRMIVIDSLTNILGRRTMNADTVLTQQIGDQALTLKDGLMRILPVIRKHNIALITTAHARAEMDQKEQMRGKTIKMANSWAVKHLAEFFCYIEPNQTKDGRSNLAGEAFEDDSTRDFMDKAEKTGHKIRFRVTESSKGVTGRTAEFTLNYENGLTNVHEEIFTLGKVTGVITKPNNVTYQYKDRPYRGLVAILTALRDDVEFQADVLKDVYAKDAE